MNPLSRLECLLLLAIIGLVVAGLLLWDKEGWAGEPSEVVLQTLAMESADQPEVGQALVALTLINRANKRGTTPEVEAKRPKQYSCWNGGGAWASVWLRSYYTKKARKQAIRAYSEGLAMSLKPEFQGIRHYHTLVVRPKWSRGVEPVIVIGQHAFYEGIA